MSYYTHTSTCTIHALYTHVHTTCTIHALYTHVHTTCTNTHTSTPHALRSIHICPHHMHYTSLETRPRVGKLPRCLVPRLALYMLYTHHMSTPLHFTCTHTILTLLCIDYLTTPVCPSPCSLKKPGPVNGTECYYWRTTGCSFGAKCRYDHLPNSKGIDLPAMM